MLFKSLEKVDVSPQLLEYDNSDNYLPDEYEVIGIDTETDAPTGNTFLICNSKGQKLISEQGKFLSSFEIFDWLFVHGRSQRKFRVNFFHNIRFDFEGMLKDFTQGLTKKQQIEFYRKHRVKISDGKKTYWIRWIPEKYFSITDHKNKAYFYDTWNYFSDSLDNVYSELFGKGKKDFQTDVDVTKGRSFLVDYVWVKRCSTDAQMTADVASKLIEGEKQILRPSRSFYGKASLSQEYAFQHIEKEHLQPFINMSEKEPIIARCMSKTQSVYYYKGKKYNRDCVKGFIEHDGFLFAVIGYKSNPNSLLKKLNDYAYRSYHGGIFNLRVKGHVTDAFALDVSSQYPYWLSQMPDMIHGQWIEVTQPSDSVFYGIYHVWMQFNPKFPFKFSKRSKLVVYPKLNDLYENWITRPELEQAIKDGLMIRMIDGIEFHHDDTIPEFPYREMILDLYDRKLKAEENGDKLFRQLYKIIMNAFYGKTIQTKGNRTSPIFNAVVGSYTTALSRLMIMTLTDCYFDEIYEIKTDSIVGRLRPEFVNKVYEIPNLIGSFIPEKPEKQFPNRIMLKTGITLDVLNNKFVKYRGFTVDKSKIRFAENEFEVETERPIHLGEAIAQGKVEDINIFESVVKKNKFTDEKMIWDSDKLTFSYLKENKVIGEPIDDDYLREYEKTETSISLMENYAELEEEMSCLLAMKPSFIRHDRSPFISIHQGIFEITIFDIVKEELKGEKLVRGLDISLAYPYAH